MRSLVQRVTYVYYLKHFRKSRGSVLARFDLMLLAVGLMTAT